MLYCPNEDCEATLSPLESLVISVSPSLIDPSFCNAGGRGGETGTESSSFGYSPPLEIPESLENNSGGQVLPFKNPKRLNMVAASRCTRWSLEFTAHACAKLRVGLNLTSNAVTLVYSAVALQRRNRKKRRACTFLNY